MGALDEEGGKLKGANLVLVLVTVGVAIASLVFNILVLNQVNAPPPIPITSNTSTTPAPLTTCDKYGTVSKAQGWQDAATQLLRGLDRTQDGCNDFYEYSCANYIADPSNPSNSYGEAQTVINLQLADYIENLLYKEATTTEYIAKTAYDFCTDSMSADLTNATVKKQRVDEVQLDLLQYIQFPLFGFEVANQSYSTLFSKIGNVERNFLSSVLVGSGTSADYKVEGSVAIYIDQAPLSFPRDYYVLPQFAANLDAYAADLYLMLKDYSDIVGKKARCEDGTVGEICLLSMAEWVVDFERLLAMASWDDTELRNYQQQYNPFKFDELPNAFRSLPLQSYVTTLTEGTRPDPFDNNIVIDQPTYMSSLDTLIQSQTVSADQLTSYLAIIFLLDTQEYHGLGLGEMLTSRAENGEELLSGMLAVQPPAVRKGRGARKLSYKPMSPLVAKTASDGIRSYCIEMLLVFMPYAPGYIYVKNSQDKRNIQSDVANQTERIISAFNDMIDTLPWISDYSKPLAHSKSSSLLRNIGWPAWFEPFDATSDAVVDQYHTDYLSIMDATTYWQAAKGMKYGMETREFWDLLNITDVDEIRSNFLQSPAMVNAWYQPEMNSITFPLAAMNPPYYSLNFPQAYNYAGQGGTAGHELTHGYDDEGVQFGPTGQLVDCSFVTCGIMDDSSRSGFTDMAQCVVQQYNLQCCPVSTGNVRCASGSNTQGENIADIGGLQAAYRAYQAYVKEERNNVPEDLLPGLTDFSLNQIFWLTYGFSWCSKVSQAQLVSQLMTDVHAPSSCRVNQVLQDIPQFGMDYLCKKAVSTLYPSDDDRCMVWVGS